MTTTIPPQTKTVTAPRPNKAELCAAFVGQPLSVLRTPAPIVDRARVQRNCTRMLQIAQDWGVAFRAHVKTHKTLEGALYQLDPKPNPNPDADAGRGLRATRAIVSTLPEAWGLLEASQANAPSDRARMCAVLDDILYALPLPLDKLDDLRALRAQLRRLSARGRDAQLRLMVDHVAQVRGLQAHMEAVGEAEPWSVFVKIESGYKRAGIPAGSGRLVELLTTVRDACPLVSVYGFYAHAGHAYGSRDAGEAGAWLGAEVRAVNDAARVAKTILAPPAGGAFVLSVGSTPTAHAAAEAEAVAGLEGVLELHAGNYAFLDLQQVATSAIPGQGGMDDVAFSLLSTVIAEYPARSASADADGDTGWGADGLAHEGDEAMCDAGGIALSKDQGPFGGYGHIVHPPSKVGWQVARASQEHGVLALRPATEHHPTPCRIGDKIRIVPQHACLAAAQYPWFYVTDSSDPSHGSIVVDIWIPWKYW